MEVNLEDLNLLLTDQAAASAVYASSHCMQTAYNANDQAGSWLSVSQFSCLQQADVH